jgi:hypothetical protein
VLRPFWEDLLTEHGDDYYGPCSFEHVLVFVEQGQSEHMQVFEILRTDRGDYESTNTSVTIRHHKDMPFAALQM